MQSTDEAASATLRQALDRERARADDLARELATLRTELDTAQVAGKEKESGQAIEVGIRQTQALEQERDKTISLTRELTFLRTELDVARIVISKAVQATEAEIKQEQALEQQERGKVEGLVQELATLRAELDTARIAASNSAKASAEQVGQKQALEQQLKQQQDGTEALKRELISLRTELDATRAATPEAARIIEAAKVEQERASAKERNRTETLARELSSARQQIEEHASRLAAAHAEVLRVMEANNATAAEQKRALISERERADALVQELALVKNQLEAGNRQLAALSASQAVALCQPATTGRNEGAAEPRAKTTDSKSALPQWASIQAVASYAERSPMSEKVEQERASTKERSRTEALARELSSARQQIEEHASRLAVAHAEVLRVTEANTTSAAEQKQALTSERERADAVVRELALVKNQLEAGNQQLAALNASQAAALRQPATTGPNEGAAEPRAKTTDSKNALPQWASIQAVALYAERSPMSETPPQAQSTAREAVPNVDPKVPAASEAPVLASVAPYSVADEQRLLVRANALLRQADISGARPLLEHALGHGSARAAFMLAETYDARVLKSWNVRGILGDPAKARELYGKARAGGIEDAKERIETLK